MSTSLIYRANGFHRARVAKIIRIWGKWQKARNKRVEAPWLLERHTTLPLSSRLDCMP